MDFITYEYMIANVLKLISGARSGRETLDLLYKCHPLGLFEGIGALTAATPQPLSLKLITSRSFCVFFKIFFFQCTSPLSLAGPPLSMPPFSPYTRV